VIEPLPKKYRLQAIEWPEADVCPKFYLPLGLLKLQYPGDTKVESRHLHFE